MKRRKPDPWVDSPEVIQLLHEMGQLKKGDRIKVNFTYAESVMEPTKLQKLSRYTWVLNEYDPRDPLLPWYAHVSGMPLIEGEWIGIKNIVAWRRHRSTHRARTRRAQQRRKS